MTPDAYPTSPSANRGIGLMVDRPGSDPDGVLRSVPRQIQWPLIPAGEASIPGRVLGAATRSTDQARLVCSTATRTDRLRHRPSFCVLMAALIRLHDDEIRISPVTWSHNRFCPLVREVGSRHATKSVVRVAGRISCSDGARAPLNARVLAHPRGGTQSLVWSTSPTTGRQRRPVGYGIHPTADMAGFWHVCTFTALPQRRVNHPRAARSPTGVHADTATSISDLPMPLE